MDTLPNEILPLIFTELDQVDKLESMCVCRRWLHVIENTCLFHTIKIKKETHFRKLVQLLLEKQHHGEQVRHFTIDMMQTTMKSIVVSRLLPSFPNLKTFKLANEHYHSYGKHYLEYPDTLISKTDPAWNAWCHSIEEITVACNLKVEDVLFPSTVFWNLRRLSLDGLDLTYVQLFTILSKTPVLSELFLIEFRLSIACLETLHTLVPTLASVTFEKSILFNTQPDKLVEPATSVISFHIHYLNGWSDDTLINWVHYISKKYPNLTDLDFSEHDDVAAGSYFTDHEEVDAFSALFESCGSKLKAISLTSYLHPPNVFDIMDASNCKIEQLTLSADSLQFSQDSLLQSNQLQTIRKLVLRHIVDCDLTFLQQIPMLNELCLHFFRHATHNTIYIFDILTDFSSHLESIQIEHYTLACGKIKVLREQSSIRRLKFVNVTFTQGVDDFLSAYAPNTRILILQHCKIDPFTMNLPNFELSYFETDNVLMPHKKSFMVKTLKDNHCQFYSSIGKRSRDNALEKESTSGSYVPHYYTELICYSIRNANIILQ